MDRQGAGLIYSAKGLVALSKLGHSRVTDQQGPVTAAQPETRRRTP